VQAVHPAHPHRAHRAHRAYHAHPTHPTHPANARLTAYTAHTPHTPCTHITRRDVSHAHLARAAAAHVVALRVTLVAAQRDVDGALADVWLRCPSEPEADDECADLYVGPLRDSRVFRKKARGRDVRDGVSTRVCRCRAACGGVKIQSPDSCDCTSAKGNSINSPLALAKGLLDPCSGGCLRRPATEVIGLRLRTADP
jgi:hypothetical protein